jgi:hypothetical protein
MRIGGTAILTLLVSTALVFLGVRAIDRASSQTRLPVTLSFLVWYALTLAFGPRFFLYSDAILLAGAVAASSLIAQAVRSPESLVVFCVAAAVADVLSYSGGLTERIVEAYRLSDNDLLLSLMVTVPVAGELRPIVGVGDLIITGTVFSVLDRARHPPLATFFAPVSGLLVALIVGLLTGGIGAIPFIAATTIGYVLWSRRSE